MIPVIQYIWKQLRGPQISAVCEAIHNFIKSYIDPKLDYFNNLTINSANDNHLTLLGSLIGVIRPKIVTGLNKYFLFTDGIKTDSNVGFSDSPESEEGGKFIDLQYLISGDNVTLLDSKYYRILLKCITESTGVKGSLVLLDDLYKVLYTTFKPGEELNYTFNVSTGSSLTRSPGDIDVFIGNESSWGIEILDINALLDSLNKWGYSPDCIIHNNYVSNAS